MKTKRRKLSSILKELDTVAHQVDQMVTEVTGEGIFDRVKRGWNNLQQREPAADDLYGILGLEPNCIPSDIVSAYRHLAKKYHPDNPATGNERTFKDIKDAFEEICRQRGIK